MCDQCGQDFCHEECLRIHYEENQVDTLAARCLVWVVWVVLGVRLTKIKKENNAHIMNINSLLFQRRKAKNFRSIGFAMKEGTDIVLPFLHDGKEEEEKEENTKVDKRKGQRRGKGRKNKERVKE